ncbi:hypothetical protein JAAARDRAFT_39906 [Jaapia argillacea MUCL 33604]|uniref:Uncharacterized protein n=1 Tax=Jaapia argillacea MUCL 33604 TaxID=933084 RepID=A0A067PMX3_9AGAM|nr:hypothetical protein JAAARDRAFT_39906 [Jaapia argillacea MUCL 33604]
MAKATTKTSTKAATEKANAKPTRQKKGSFPFDLPALPPLTTPMMLWCWLRIHSSPPLS